METMYELPEQKNLVRCVVDAASVAKTEQPKLIFKENLSKTA
jgi:ATP-dependent protease Clp ATPase subunit